MVDILGGELVFSLSLEITNDHILGTWHVIWKYQDKYYEVTEAEPGWKIDDRTHIIFLLDIEPTAYRIIPGKHCFVNSKIYITDKKKKNNQQFMKSNAKLWLQNKFDVI